MSQAASVLIVDDHRMFREGIRSRLEQEQGFEVIGEAANFDQAVRALEVKAPDMLILDIRMPGKSGIELARKIRRDWPGVKILVVSGFDYDQYVRALARIGIHGYLLKDAPQDELIDALKAIAEGGVVLPPRIASKVMKSYGSHPDIKRAASLWELTVREIDILELLYEGLRNADIGERLDISPRTVETHVRNIVSKMGVQNRAEAVRKALEEGLLK